VRRPAYVKANELAEVTKVRIHTVLLLRILTRALLCRFSFGSADRDSYQKQFLSADHQSKMPLSTTVKVDYMPEMTSIGKMSDSTRKTLPQYKFSQAPRDQYQRQYLSPDHQSKMPQATTTAVDFMSDRPSCGKMSESQRRTLPSFSFSHAPRSEYEKQFLTPGHQSKMVQLTTKDVDFGPERTTMGPQATLKQTPSFGFGTTSREARSLVFQSPRDT
jgi:hypothetical protein